MAAKIFAFISRLPRYTRSIPSQIAQRQHFWAAKPSRAHLSHPASGLGRWGRAMISMSKATSASGPLRTGLTLRPKDAFSRMPPPKGSNTTARGWPWSGLEIRERQCRGCACYTYHRDARPNLLKLSESLAGTISRLSLPSLFLKSGARANSRPPAVQNSRPGTIAFKCMGQKNACTHQAHHRCNRLDHRTNPLRPRAIHRTTTALHSQKDSKARIAIGGE
jgi:hypothetical protein